MMLRSEATKVAERVPATVGIDPVTILMIVTTLLPTLLKCFQESTEATGTTAKQYLQDHYDEDTGEFDHGVVERARHRTRAAARKEGQRRLSREQLDAITVASFKQAIEADDATVAACASEASRLEDLS